MAEFGDVTCIESESYQIWKPGERSNTMRLALLSDIHGNFIALKTVLQEIAHESIDQILCLGDVAALGPQPHEVVECLCHLSCPVILGNTDAWLLAAPGEKTSESETLRSITSWCAEQLTSEDRAYLHTFVPLLKFPLEHGKTLLCYHGSPRSFEDIIASSTPAASIEQMLTGHTATIMVGGHTHIQMLRRHANACLVNVGSVGLAGMNVGSPELPLNRNVHWAEYGIICSGGNRLSIDLRCIPLDMNAVLEAGELSRMPHKEWWMQKWECK